MRVTLLLPLLLAACAADVPTDGGPWSRTLARVVDKGFETLEDDGSEYPCAASGLPAELVRSPERLAVLIEEEGVPLDVGLWERVNEAYERFVVTWTRCGSTGDGREVRLRDAWTDDAGLLRVRWEVPAEGDDVPGLAWMVLAVQSLEAVRGEAEVAYRE